MPTRRIAALLILAAAALLWQGAAEGPEGHAVRLLAAVVLSAGVLALRESSRPL